MADDNFSSGRWHIIPLGVPINIYLLGHTNCTESMKQLKDYAAQLIIIIFFK